MHHQQTVIIYHGRCPDGFGGAYAAWKKYGDTAEYIPAQYGKPSPEHMDGRQLFFVDFCYGKEQMDQLASVASSLTVLDHHEGVRDVATTFPGVFDSDRSGATIAWNYFHPDTPIPKLVAHLEDYDLFRFALLDTKAVNAYLSLEPYDFERWDEIARMLEDSSARTEILERGRIYAEHSDKLIEHLAANADLVEFEGYTVYFTGTGVQAFTDFVGNLLARKHPPFALVARPSANGLSVSMRGDGSVDVAEIARRFGGNGHPSAAAFRLTWDTPVPWKLAPKDENPRH